MKNMKKIVFGSVLGTLALTQTSYAELGFSGYMRGVVGVSQGGGDAVCFQAPGADTKYRFGNECDYVGEFLFENKIPTDGSSMWKSHVMIQTYKVSPDLDFDTGFAQTYVSGHNLGGGILEGASIWGGKRYDRVITSLTDHFLISSDGMGVGVDNLNLGSVKASYSVKRNYLDSTDGSNIYLFHTLKFADISVGLGKLTVYGGYINGSAAPQNSQGENNVRLKDGGQLSLHHRVGGNHFVLQYGAGSLVSLKLNNPNTSTNADDTVLRVVDEFAFKAGSFSSQIHALYQSKKIGDATTTWTSFGLRPEYMLSDKFALVLDAGHDVVKPDEGDSVEMTKATFALAVSNGGKAMSRPVLRFFYTYASWNDAANASSTGPVVQSSVNPFAGETTGSSAGVQTEVWF